MEKVLATGGGIFSAARTEEDLLNMLTRQMRFVLVDYARAHNGGKRADPHARVSFEDVERTEPVTHLNIEQVLIVNEILEKLTIHDAAAAQAFELRFFAGLTNEEAAAAMGISLSAFRRHLKRADIFVRRIANPLPSGGEEEGSRA
jgi:RNA polymerase sigma factor (sigma-70 family)